MRPVRINCPGFHIAWQVLLGKQVRRSFPSLVRIGKSQRFNLVSPSLLRKQLRTAMRCPESIRIASDRRKIESTAL